MNCPHGRDGRHCRECDPAHECNVCHELLPKPGAKCPHEYPHGVGCPACGFYAHYRLEWKKCTHGGDPFPDGTPCTLCAAARNAPKPTNCPQPCKRCGGPRTPIEGAPSILECAACTALLNAKPSNCPHCGKPSPCGCACWPCLRGAAAARARGKFPCAHAPIRDGAITCPACAEEAKAALPAWMQGALGAMTRGVVSAVLARAERVIMTTCEGQAHELLRALATCEHAHTTMLPPDRKTPPLAICIDCGACRIGAHPWRLPKLAKAAKALDGETAASGAPTEPAPPDSEEKNDK